MKTYITIFFGSFCGFFFGQFIIELAKAIWRHL